MDKITLWWVAGIISFLHLFILFVSASEVNLNLSEKFKAYNWIMLYVLILSIAELIRLTR